MIISKAVTPFLRLSNRSTVVIWFMSHLKKEPLASLPTGIGCIPSLVLLSKVLAWLQGK
jgi:hypothetical protein